MRGAARGPTERYTHLRPVHEIPAHERLADAVPIADLVTAPRKRASGKGAGKNAPDAEVNLPVITKPTRSRASRQPAS